MTATIPDDVTTAAKPKVRLGRGFAFPTNGYGTGMTEREYIATVTLNGLLADGAGMGEPAEVARDAVAFADALLAELAK